ncbi:hypothetical protein TRFO_41543 [Tritrichomonas foetus]|uniref:Uncharacterized protein n=1 Tax=Tritrichomonas foetus TaxID=1144522 RepID=A0A1J4L484_9EUKA|nr:hypothetical protein TRFO_41543 [Tritrichomonas foetus]|eukprot:OHT16788.1 hypothetical protein TRFO_41543 [Tritrichomonas foetus]
MLASLHRDTSIKIRSPSPSSTKGPRLYPPPQPPQFPQFNVPPYRRKIEKPELCEMTQDFIEDPEANMPDDLEDCRIIKNDLKKERQYLIDEQQYPEALKFHQDLVLIDAKIWELDHESDKTATLRHSMTKHQEIEQVVAAYLSEWDKNYEEFLETTQTELEQIEEGNRQELELFDQNIPTGLSIEFRKPSMRLLNLRSAEKRLAYSNQLSFALQLKQRANLIEQQEAERQYLKQVKIIKERRARLVNSHKQKVKHFLDHVNSMRIVMIQSRNKAVGGYMKRLNFLDNQIEDISNDLNVDVSAVCHSSLDEERAEFVKQEELTSPIPHFQPGKAFSASRRKAKENSERTQRSERAGQAGRPQRNLTQPTGANRHCVSARRTIH